MQCVTSVVAIFSTEEICCTRLLLWNLLKCFLFNCY